MITTQRAMNQYRVMDTEVRAEYADPHRLIIMLFEGAKKSLNLVPVLMENNDLEAKSRELTRAVNIINGLRDCLDLEKGGDLAENLSELYLYMSSKLMESGLSNDVESVRHVKSLLNEISEGWEAISP